jgi:hypothetical protein
VHQIAAKVRDWSARWELQKSLHEVLPVRRQERDLGVSLQHLEHGMRDALRTSCFQ